MKFLQSQGGMHGWLGRGGELRRQMRQLRRRILFLLAIVGPGVIASNVNNEAGGIFTYSVAGARFGYGVLWIVIPMGISLYIIQEICARTGAVTGKGLSDLIREEYGFRVTFFVMLAEMLVNLGNMLAEFAGIAAAMEMFGVTRYVSVPIAVLVICGMVLQGTAKWMEKIFTAFCLVYLTYIASAVLAKPNWFKAVLNLLPTPLVGWVPHINQWVEIPQPSASYLLIIAGLLGATIAPWQFFFLQGAVVEKRVSVREYQKTRIDVIVGTISACIIIFFIIVCTAATLHVSGRTEIHDAGDAARALEPLAGRWASLLFGIGLLNSSLFAAWILPLSTCYTVCEGLGFEAGVDRKWSEAPIFYSIYFGMVVVSAALILLPSAPLVKIAVFSQVANGFLLPVVLIFMLLLVNRRDLMGEHVNSRTFNVLAWLTAIGMIILTATLTVLALLGYETFGG